MRERGVADARQHLLVRQPDGARRGQTENALRRAVERRHDARGIGGDNAAGDRGEDIVHVRLDLGNFADVAAQVVEEAGIVYGDGRLIAECGEQVEVSTVEEAALTATIHVDNADGAPPHPQRRAHYRADALHHHTLVLAQPLIHLGVSGEQRALALPDLTHDIAAQSKIALSQWAVAHTARRREAQIISRCVAGRLTKHQEAALGVHHFDELVEDAAEHVVEVERGVEVLGDLVQHRQPLALALQRGDVILRRLHRFIEASQGVFELRQPQIGAARGFERLPQQTRARIAQVAGELALGDWFERACQPVHSGGDLGHARGDRGDILPGARLGSAYHSRRLGRL